MTFRELQRLLSKRYVINAALANETAAMLIRDELGSLAKMTPEQVNAILTALEARGGDTDALAR